MMSEHRKAIVAELKQYAAKQVAADKTSPWTKLSTLSDEQIAAVTGATGGIEGAKTRASKFVRGKLTASQLPTDFAKLADPKYVALKNQTKAEKAKAEESTAGPKKPAEPTEKPTETKAEATAVENLQKTLAGKK
jgi:hypothetical protein